LLFELRQISVMLFSIAAVSESWYARGAHRQAAGHTRHTTMQRTEREYAPVAADVLPDTRNLTPEHSACKTGFCKRIYVFVD
jgi:hypothetical protein